MIASGRINADELVIQAKERIAKLEKANKTLHARIFKLARSEEALRKSVEKYHTLFNTIDEGFFLIEMMFDDKGKPVDYRILEANQSQEKITGLYDIVGKRAREFSLNLKDNWIKRFGNVALTGDSVQLEEWSDAVKRWFEVSASRIGGKDSRKVAVLFKDITERKKAEEEKSLLNTIRAERDKLSALVNNIPDEVWFADTNRKFVLANPSALQEFGLVSKEINVEKMVEELEIYRPDGSPRPVDEAPPLRALKGEVVRNLEEIIRTPASNELRYRQVNASPVKDTYGNIIGSVSVVRDITDRKLTEESLEKEYNILEEKVKERTAELERSYNLLKESERSLSEAQKMAHIGNWYRNLITNEIYWSDEVYRIFGFEPQEFGVDYDLFLSRVHPDDQDYLRKSAKQALEKKLSGIDYRILMNNGEERIVHEEVKVFFNEENIPVQIRGTVQDITERKKSESALINLETARQREIHHRIKNNLQVISSLLDLQAERFNNKEYVENSEVLEAFRESQNRVMSISLIHEELYEGEKTDKLDFSLYLRRLVEDFFQIYRLGNINIILKTDLEENVFFDMDIAVPLGMIVSELISNSFKYAFPGRKDGEIHIKLLSEETKEEKNDNLLAGKNTRYSLIVSDNGIGVPENIDFKNPETLGLQLVTVLVNQLDGEVELKRDNGTEYIIGFNLEEKRKE